MIDLMVHRPRIENHCTAMGCAILTAEGNAEEYCLEPFLSTEGLMGLESE